MAGTSAGGLKASAKNKARFGSDYYAMIGAKGGSARNPRKGFGSSHERAAEAGRKGGQISKRGPVEASVPEQSRNRWHFWKRTNEEFDHE